MKAVKIVLVAIVLGTIGFFVFQRTAIPPPPITPSTSSTAADLFIQKIQTETDSLRTVTDKVFSKSFFNEIQAELETFYKAGYLGNDSIQNKQEYINLSKTLFAAYVPNLIDEAYYKFGRSNWRKEDLTFIRDEINEIERNKFFDGASSFKMKFDKINAIISKYYEIEAFIQRCGAYPSNLDYSVDGRFPVDETTEIIAQSQEYLRMGTGYGYIGNVNWLRKELNVITLDMYEQNIIFLQRQIQQNSGIYNNGTLDSQADYSREIYQPLKNSLDAFENEMYGVNYNPEFLNDYNKLKKMLDDDNDNAGKYFRELFDEQIKNQIKP